MRVRRFQAGIPGGIDPQLLACPLPIQKGNTRQIGSIIIVALILFYFLLQQRKNKRETNSQIH